MLEVLLSMILIFTVFNFVMLYRLSGKRQIQNDSALYEEQIKTLKKVIRLNDKMLKSEKEKRDYEKMAESKQQENLVQIDRRIY